MHQETHQLCKEATQKRYKKLRKASSCFGISTLTYDKDETDKTVINGELSIELEQVITTIWRETSKSLLKKARSRSVVETCQNTATLSGLIIRDLLPGFRSITSRECSNTPNLTGRGMDTSNSFGTTEQQKDGHRTSHGYVQQGDEIKNTMKTNENKSQHETSHQPDQAQEQNLSDTMNENENKTTSKGNNGQQQIVPQPDWSQELELSDDTISTLTIKEERMIRQEHELDLLRGRLKALEEEKKNLQDELTKKEIKILELQGDIIRRPTNPTSTYFKDQRVLGRPERPRSACPSDQRVERHSREEMQMKMEQQQSIITHLAQKLEACERHRNEMDALKGKLKNCEHLINSLREEKLNIEKTINGLKEDKDELLNRLSKIASDRLTHENTDITDLSDEIRPTKLAEKMSELYDNQWTNAFDELKTNWADDKNAIDMLLTIVMETNQVCKEMTLSHYQKLKEACICFEYSSSSDAENKEKGKISTKGKFSIEMQQDIKRIWRESSKKVVKKVSPIIVKKVSEKFEFPISVMSQTQLYMKECVELCWMMNLQEKPMHLDISVSRQDGNQYFDTEKFRSYTKTGQQVAFVVWPALYLFDGGSLLKKGIAQGLKFEKGTSGQKVSSMPCS
ncbi:hypothetical protein CHS0354_030859 [Potamilus streckersoni]|uniref:Mitochondria-eating protein C-terminal domain-containing protein n=1 Tax=Potamilus streckersoni TaxID=2493646 RepID=A0AAE0SMM3_9BIVA|nr:hypothetical protein CHS0354_030859 [Potamilus streckersoni]